MTDTLSITTLIVTLLGGLALFLHGMHEMTTALTSLAGGKMKLVMARLISNRVSAATAGAVITAIIQSSSITTVLVTGFISAGLMTFQQSVSVILGANLGTTITAQIIAFKITKSAMVLMAGGFLLQSFATKNHWKKTGSLILGLGLLFLGLELMSQATEPLRTYRPFMEWMEHLDNPFSAIALGLTFTALVQSSSATTGLVIVFASQGLLTLEHGIAVVLGANIGTCITALISAIGKPRDALRAALAHVIINVAGVAVWLAFIPELAALVAYHQPNALPAETLPRQIANAHTLFNLANLLMFLGFTPQIAKLVMWLLPTHTTPESDIASTRPHYLDSLYLLHPDLALDQVKLELNRIGMMTLSMTDSSFGLISSGFSEQRIKLEQCDEAVNSLHEQVIEYLRQLSANSINPRQADEIYRCMSMANDLENVGDVIKQQMSSVQQARESANFHMSLTTSALLKTIHDEVTRLGRLSLQATAENDAVKARAVIDSKAGVRRRIELARIHLARRLVASDPASLAAYRLESDILEDYQRIHSLYRRIAKLLRNQNKGISQASP